MDQKNFDQELYDRAVRIVNAQQHNTEEREIRASTQEEIKFDENQR